MRPVQSLLLLGTLPLFGGDPPRLPRDTEALRTFYAENCVRCHAPDGSAAGPDGKRLKGANFTDAKAMEREKDASLAKVILKGKLFGMEMPSFKDKLTEDEALRMVKDILRKAERGKAIAPGSAAK